METGGAEEWVPVEEQGIEANMELVFHGFRQGATQARKDIVRDLEERLGQLRKSAIRLEAGKWTTMTPCGVRGRLEEAVYCLWIARGFPGHGISYGAWEMPYPLRGHGVAIRGYPVRDPVGYTVACGCARNLLAEGMAEDEWGWSPTVMGAKRLARRHAGLM